VSLQTYWHRAREQRAWRVCRRSDLWADVGEDERAELACPECQHKLMLWEAPSHSVSAKYRSFKALCMNKKPHRLLVVMDDTWYSENDSLADLGVGP
jgi:DNA-directed RNA polymerase subunit RPC12/RpoP